MSKVLGAPSANLYFRASGPLRGFQDEAVGPRPGTDWAWYWLEAAISSHFYPCSSNDNLSAMSEVNEYLNLILEPWWSSMWVPFEFKEDSARQKEEAFPSNIFLLLRHTVNFPLVP